MREPCEALCTTTDCNLEFAPQFVADDRGIRGQIAVHFGSASFEEIGASLSLSSQAREATGIVGKLTSSIGG